MEIFAITAACKAHFRWVVAAAVFGLSTWPCSLHASPPAAYTPSEAVARIAERLHEARDPDGKPFAIVDKESAVLSVFDSRGRLAGSSPVLLGRTLGDLSSPGVGERAESGTLRVTDLTTPAGRFNSEPGRNHDGDTVIWVDYAAAFAIHRLRGGLRTADRAHRLTQPGSAGKRVTAGCVVVPVAFFERVVLQILGSGSAVVYVLPEQRFEANALNPARSSGSPLH